MGLLDELRQGTTTTDNRHNLWKELPTLLQQTDPSYNHIKTVLIRGEVIVNGFFTTSFRPRHIYAVLHNEQTAQDPATSKKFPHHAGLPGPRPGRARPVAMGISSYRAEAETNYYTDPWVGWVDPTPEALTAWIIRIITDTSKDTPRLEQQHRAKKLG